MQKSAAFFTLTLVMAFTSASAARADPFIFSTLPASGGVLLTEDDEYEDAFGFIPTVSGVVHRLTVPVGPVWSDSTPWSFIFRLWTSNDATPHESLTSFKLSGVTHPEGFTAELPASTPVELSAGELYFLTVVSFDMNNLFEGSSGVTGPILRQFHDDPWIPHRDHRATLAFALSGADPAPVPEPATLLLMGIGAAGLAAHKRVTARRAAR